ncbi:MAG: hypothetical protein J6A15_08185 [Clostridia bacterium]|nr:hypothetical protein [Clostridia bacterium]
MKKDITVEDAIKELEPEIDKILMEMGALKIIDGKKEYAFGSINTIWSLQKKLLKERYDIDWETPQERNPHITVD